jgi:hypothetical protein
VKVVQPTRLVAEAAEVLEAMRDDVVVVGAAALEIVLSDADTFVTPTRDVDVVVPTERVMDVVRELEASGLERSRQPHEASFTWVRDELKVQLVRTFHPFPKGVARGLPDNPVFGMASHRAHADEVAFTESPEVPRLWSANAACLLALKQAAFGRKRGPNAEPVERDFHDAYLLLEHSAAEIAAQLRAASYELRTRVEDAMVQLAAGDDATSAAARQMVRVGQASTQRGAEAAVRRAAARAQRILQPVFGRARR